MSIIERITPEIMKIKLDISVADLMCLNIDHSTILYLVNKGTGKENIEDRKIFITKDPSESSRNDGNIRIKYEIFNHDIVRALKAMIKDTIDIINKSNKEISGICIERTNDGDVWGVRILAPQE